MQKKKKEKKEKKKAQVTSVSKRTKYDRDIEAYSLTDCLDRAAEPEDNRTAWIMYRKGGEAHLPAPAEMGGGNFN